MMKLLNKARAKARSLVTGAAVTGFGGVLGAAIGYRLIGELRNMDHESVHKLAQKYMPFFMSFADRDVTAESVGMYACDECGTEFMPLFMLHDELWWTILTPDERDRQFDVETKSALPLNDSRHRKVGLCLKCCAARLGRQLYPDDFLKGYMTTPLLADAAETVRPTPPGPKVVMN